MLLLHITTANLLLLGFQARTEANRQLHSACKPAVYVIGL